MPRPKQLYSLKEIERRTGISYPTLIKYAREHADQIPVVGKGRRRQYPREAIKVFQRILRHSRPGRRSGEAWKKSPPATPDIGSPSARQEGVLKLADEDRQLIRDLLKALQDLRDTSRRQKAEEWAIRAEDRKVNP